MSYACCGFSTVGDHLVCDSPYRQLYIHGIILSPSVVSVTAMCIAACLTMCGATLA